MTNLLAPMPKAKFFDNSGKPAVSYRLFTYRAGTSTKADTFPSAGAVLANPNPITLDYRGETNVWIPPNVAYKFVFAPPGPGTDDPPTAPIWTVDNIVDSQLITLYGGVDSGITNAYVLNFVANFTQYEDGIVIYWIPSNTNAGSSTINVNGLGPVAIQNQDGSPLAGGSLRANQVAQIIYKGTGFRLLSITLVPVAFGACRTSVQNFAASTITDVIFDSNVNNPQSAYNLATGVFTAPDSGNYVFNACVILENQNAAAGVLNGVYISRNNSTGTPGSSVFLGGYSLSGSIGGASLAFSATGSAIFALVAGDTVRVKVDTGAGFGGAGNFRAITRSFFSGTRVS